MKKSILAVVSAVIVILIYILSQVLVQYIYAFVVYFRNLDPNRDFAEALFPAISNINNNKDIFSLITIALAVVIIYYHYCRRKGEYGISFNVKSLKSVDCIIWMIFGVTLSTCFYMILVFFNIIDIDVSGVEIGIRYFLVSCMVVPVFEEWLYRNVVMTILLKNMHIIPTIIIRAFLFSVIHASNTQKIYTFFLALVLGVVMIETNNFIVTSYIHIVFNVVGLGVIDVYSLNTVTRGVVLFVSTVISVVLLLYETGKCNKNKQLN